MKTNMQSCLAKYMDTLCCFLEFDLSGGGGLNGEEAHFKLWLKEAALITKGDLAERGELNRAFTVS